MLKKYTNLHIMMHKCGGFGSKPLTLTLVFLSAAALQLASACLILLLSAHGSYDYHSAVRYVPVMMESAALSAALSVGGGALLDLILKGK